MIVPTLDETRADFIGPLNPHVGRYEPPTMPDPADREALAIVIVIALVLAAFAGGMILA